MSTAALVVEAAPAAYLQQFNRVAAGPVAPYVPITFAGALRVVSAAPCICYGYIVTTVMPAVVTTMYDNASAASGQVLFTIPASAAAGTQVIWPTGVLLNLGLTASSQASGAINFLIAPSA